jgi:hypothetical protein
MRTPEATIYQPSGTKSPAAVDVSDHRYETLHQCPGITFQADSETLIKMKLRRIVLL